MNESEVIFYTLSKFHHTRKYVHFVAALFLAMKQRRLLEVLYGVFCFLTKKPSRVHDQVDTDTTREILKAGRTSTATLYAQRERVLLDASSHLNGNVAQLRCRIHGFILTRNGYAIGEYAYAEESSRLFVKNKEAFVTHKPYGSDHGVRHIHSILLHGGFAFISTGDSNKYLDRYKLVKGDLHFDSRVMRHLGGFTACCVFNGMCFFGTDFSERPNYIFCFETRRKFFFHVQHTRTTASSCCHSVTVTSFA